MPNRQIIKIAILALPLFLAACGSKKKLVTDNPTTNTNTPAVNTPGNTSPAVKHSDNAVYLKRVTDNASTAKNLVASLDFNLKSGKKDISVSGKISMRKDEVIRIQLSPMGLVEVGRMEFTRDSVLIMDRMHKQYLKNSYGQVSFLKNNGIDFYALQALFWNQLFVPGEKTVGKAISRFDVEGSKVSLSTGKMSYLWTLDQQVERILSAVATYASTKNGTSRLEWAYDKFTTFSGKPFPAEQKIKIITPSSKPDAAAREILVGLTMKNFKTDSSWETTTKVSSKYKPVELKDVINQIMNLQ